MFKLFPDKEAISSELALLHRICSDVNLLLFKRSQTNSNNYYLNMNPKLYRSHCIFDTVVKFSFGGVLIENDNNWNGKTGGETYKNS